MSSEAKRTRLDAEECRTIEEDVKPVLERPPASPSGQQDAEAEATSLLQRLATLPGSSSTELETIRQEFAGAITPLIAWNRTLQHQLDEDRVEFHRRELEFERREEHIVAVLRTEGVRMGSIHTQIVTDYEGKLTSLKAEQANEIAKLKAALTVAEKQSQATQRLLDGKNGRIEELKLQLEKRAEIGGDFNVDAPAIRQYRLQIEAKIRAEEREKRKMALAELDVAHKNERKDFRTKLRTSQNTIDAYASRQRERLEADFRRPQCSTCERRIERDEEIFTCLDDGCMEKMEPSRKGRIVIDLESETTVKTPSHHSILKKFCPLCIIRSHKRHHSAPLGSMASEEALANAIETITSIRTEINGALLEKHAAHRELLNETLPEKNGLIDQSLACLSTGRPLLQSYVERETAKVVEMRDAFAQYIDGEFAAIIEEVKAKIRGQRAWMPA